ncbi:MAG TPA: class II aldolase/adducin family protein [Kofleriaceae bacterium]|jgi:HCOMODA/2-hydroxy-3-carboxy-muconic semialdehyde decarboxylase
MSDVALAARALARHGLVHAYGHVSARSGDGFVVTGPHPLRIAAPLVEVSLDGALPPGALPEVRMHQAIYRARPDVGGICRFQSPSVIALSAIGKTPRALHGLGAYAPDAPLWDDPLLVRDPERAAGVATQLGAARAIVLRGNGAISVGATVREAACHAFFLEDAARVELAVLATREAAVPYTRAQCDARGAGDAQLYARMWEFLVADSEAS